MTGATATRLVRALAHLVLVLFALVLVLALCTLLALRTAWGSRLVLTQLLPRINAEIQGRVDIARISLSPGRAALYGLALRDPEGAPVLQATSVEVQFSPWSLFHREVDVPSAKIVAPELDLRFDRRGNSNLSRAIEQRHGSAGREASTPEANEPWSFKLGRLTVRDARVAVVDQRLSAEAAWKSVRFAAAEVLVDGHYGGEGPRGFAINLGIRGALEEPFSAPVRVSLASSGGVSGPSAIHARAGLAVGDSRADVVAQVRHAEGLGAARVTIERVEVEPRLLRGFVKAWPITAVVKGSGDLAWNAKDGGLRLDMKLAAGGTALTIAAEAAWGRLRLTGMRVSAPGLTMTAEGSATSSALDVRGSVALSDLGSLLQSLSRSTGDSPAQGGGRLAFAVSGSPARPSVRIAGRLDRMVWNDIAVPRAALDLRLPDAGNPFAADLTLRVPEARVGQRHLRGIEVLAQGAGPAFRLRVGLAQPEHVALSFGGRWSSNHARLTISHARLSLPRASWTLQRNAALSVAGSRIELGNLSLASGDQALRLDFDKRPHELSVRASLARLDLSRLPRRLLPLPRVAGQVSVDLDLRQSARSRSATASVRLAQGRIGAVDRIDSTVDAELDGERAKARFTASALGARAHGQMSLPIRWPPRPTSTISADFNVSAIDLDSVMSALSRAQPGLSGTGSATVSVRGTAERPDVVVDLGVAGLRWQDTPIGDLRLALDTTSDAGPVGTLALGTATQGIGPVTLNLRGERRLPPLFAGQDLASELATLPVLAELRAERLDLPTLARLLGRPGVEGGAASVSARLAGNASSGEGDIAVDIVGLAGPGLPPTDGRAHVALRGREVHADLGITRRRANLLTATASLHAPLAQLAHPARLADTPVELRATLGPLAWQHVGVVSRLGRPRVLRGHLGAELELTGTPRRPSARVMAKTPDVRLDDKPVGAAAALLDYRDGLLEGHVSLVSTDGGRLLATASLPADLGYPAVLDPPPARDLPISASLQAAQFDLAALSGLSPTLRTVEGRIDANMEVSGTLADPRPAGQLEWKNGRLAMVGIGDYENIHLLVRGDRDRLSIEELRADSGSGHAKLTMSATHRDRGYDITSQIDLDKLPIYVQGQSLASISLDAKARARIDSGQVRSHIEIGSSHVRLSDAKRKRLQDLSQPDDVILVEDGRPIDEEQARKLAQVNAALAHEPLEPEGQPPPTKPEGATIVLLLDAPRDVWLAGKDANLEIGLEPGFRVELADQVRVYGQVVVKRGYVEVLGSRFDLKESSTLRFSGPPDRPALDVTAEHFNAENDVTVVATIQGSPDHLETELTAPGRPDLTESQLYTLVLTGRLGFGSRSSTPSTPADQAGSLLGGLLASQLQTLAGSRLPLDVLTIQTGATAGSARVEAGKYVTSDLYVGYVGRVGADPTRLQNRNAVHFEYALGSRWSFQGEYGDAKTGSLDLFWTKRY